MTALLMLEDGSIFHGSSIGAPGFAVGEVVFNTAMTGYQEILTDPSYARQIVTLTYPHIGNTGVNGDDVESGQIWAAGLVIRDCPTTHSSWRTKQSLPDYLVSAGTVAIADLDTRRLTRLIREKGALAGCIAAGPDASPGRGADAGQGVPRPRGHGLGQGRFALPYRDLAGWRLVAGTRVCRSRREPGRTSRGGLRLRRQAQHPTHVHGPRLPGHGCAGANCGRNRNRARA